jgi:hypothetical protein
MFFWLWKLHVIEQGTNPRPNSQSTKLLTRNTHLRPKTKKTQRFFHTLHALVGPRFALTKRSGEGPHTFF